MVFFCQKTSLDAGLEKKFNIDKKKRFGNGEFKLQIKL